MALKDPKGPAIGADRVVRGGSCGGGAQSLRSANRNGGDPGDRYDLVGFRLVREDKVILGSLTLDPLKSETREAIVELIRNKLKEIEEQMERLK
jgi:hypothetical protein